MEYMADNALDLSEGSAAAAENTEEKDVSTQGEMSGGIEEAGSETEEGGSGEISEEEAPAAADNNGNDDITKTKAFSQRLNAMSERKVNEFIAQMGWKNDYLGGKPIATKADYDEFIAMHNAAQRGNDPVATAKIHRLEGELSSIKISRQDEEMSNDKVFGALYKEHRDEVLSLVNSARQNGMNVDVKGAFNAVLMQGENFSKIIAKERAEAERAAIAKLKNNNTSSAGSLGENTDSKGIDIASMSSEEFNKLVKRVTNGEKIKL